MVNGKWLPDFIERLKASAWHQLYLPLSAGTLTLSPERQSARMSKITNND